MIFISGVCLKRRIRGRLEDLDDENKLEAVDKATAARPTSGQDVKPTLPCTNPDLVHEVGKMN